MPNDNLARLEQFSTDRQPSNAAEPLGRVVSVGGSQVMVEFSNAVLSSGETDLTVGAFLGVWNGRTLVVGSLCDISLHKLADGQQSGPATGRVDLLGELILDKPGAGYFQRGVMTYPRIGSPVVPVGHVAGREREEEHRDDLHQPDVSQDQWRFDGLVQVPPHHHAQHLRGEVRQGCSGQQIAVISRSEGGVCGHG